MTTRKILSSLAACAALLVAFGLAAHDDGDRDHDRDHERLKANLIGWQEVPALASGGTAVFRAKIASDDQSFDWELTFSGLTNVTQSHIHVGQRGVSGAIVIFLCTNLGNAAPAGITVAACPTSAGTVTGTATAANVIGVAAQGVAAGDFATVLDAIRAGVAYANIHTVAHPPGEIRGQISHDH
jgi:hypothetical protein